MKFVWLTGIVIGLQAGAQAAGTLVPPPIVTVSIVATARGVDSYDFSSTVIPSAGATIATFAWDFGDGGKASGSTASHRYIASGTYPVVLTVKDSKNITGTASKVVIATLPIAGTSADRVRIGRFSTTSTYASKLLQVPWIKPGGDWLDGDGTLHGPKPTITIVAAPSVTVDISKIDGDLLIRGANAVDAPFIDGLPATGFWVDPSAPAQSLPSKWGANVFVVNDGGKSLTLKFPNAADYGKTVRIDRVAGPRVPADLPVVGPSNRPDIAELEMTNEAAIKALGASNISPPYAFNPEFGVDATSGIKYLRFSSTTASRLISWWLRFAAREEAYGRYMIFIEDDVADGMTELGVKLPGLVSGTPGASGEVSWRMEHGQNDRANRGFYRLVDYMYSAESVKGGYGNSTDMGVILRAGRWYVIEQHAKLNTPGVSDGVAEVFVNGNRVWSRSDMKFRNLATTMLTMLHLNVYHGGVLAPSQPIHYRIAKIAVGSSYIGPPGELPRDVLPPTTTPPPSSPPDTTPPPPPSSTGSYPTWRRSMAKDVIARLPATSPRSAGQYNWVTLWCGMAAGDTTIYVAACSGHANNGLVYGWQNATYKLDLLSDAPKWVTLDPSSTKEVVEAGKDSRRDPDGRPHGRHTYFTTQYVKARNSVILFGAFATVFSELPGLYKGGPHVDGFNLTSNKWDPVDTYPNIPALLVVPSIAKHPVTEDVYLAGYGYFFRWSMLTNTWTRLPTPINLGAFPLNEWQYRGSLIDTKRNEWVHLHRQSDSIPGPKLQRLNLATLVNVNIPITGPLAVVSGGQLDSYIPIVHDTDNDRYLTVKMHPDGKSGLYAINPDTGASSLLAEVPTADNGTQSRLAFFPVLGGAAYLPTVDSDIIFIPTR